MIANGEFIRLSGGPGIARRLDKPSIHNQVVVVSIGGCGAPIAKFLHLWGAGGLDVTFIEPDRSDAVLPAINRKQAVAGAADKSGELGARYGIRVLAGHIESIDPVSGILMLADGTTLPFDRLVVAPGLELGRQPWPPIMDI